MGWLIIISNLLRGAWTALLSFRLGRANDRADKAEDRADAAEAYVETRKELDNAPVASDAADARRRLSERNAARKASKPRG